MIIQYHCKNINYMDKIKLRLVIIIIIILEACYYPKYILSLNLFSIDLLLP